MSARVIHPRSIPRRYQLNKGAYGVLALGHPWIFRSHVSSALSAFVDGQWLALYDGKNRLVGHGIYQAEGAIAIRVLGIGDKRPMAAVWNARIDAAIAKRAELRRTTNAVRVIHGESDGLPGVVVEQLGEVVVVQSYAVGSDGLARMAARRVAAATGAKTIISRPAHRRQASTAPLRVLRGSLPTTLRITEDKLEFAVDPVGGQKTGAFLDLRGLRRLVRALPLTSARVLNLFSYTGMLGVAVEAAGASHITQVDSSASALKWASEHHVADPAKHNLVEADVFTWLPAQPPSPIHQLVIVDPPSMTSRVEQVPKALASYRKLYTHAREQVAPGGLLVAACCTSRIGRDTFRKTVTTALGDNFILETELSVEPDHPVTFAQADYLKVVTFRRKPAAT